MLEDSENHMTEANDSNRPKWSIQIYDTTPRAADHSHVRERARCLEEETESKRNSGDYYPDRIDVYGLPMPASASPEERVNTCIKHLNAEIAARDATGLGSFFIPKASTMWERELIIISKHEREWNEEDGGFIIVRYRSAPPPPLPEGVSNLHWHMCTREALYNMFLRGDFRESIQWFYETFIEEGRMDDHLREQRKKHMGSQGHDLPLRD